MKKIFFKSLILSTSLFANESIDFNIDYATKATLEIVDRDLFVTIKGEKSKLKGVVDFTQLRKNDMVKTFIFKDYNFDGKKDIAILVSYGASDVYRDIYIYDNATKKYKRSLKDISNVTIDEDNREVISSQRNSAFEYENRYYRVDDKSQLYLSVNEKITPKNTQVTIYNKNKRIKSTFIKIKDISTIKEIKQEYSHIINSLNKLTKSKYNLTSFSTEGGEVELFKNSNKDIVFAHLTLYGEMYKIDYNFYFRNNTLFFVYSTKLEYNEPNYSEGFDLTKAIKKVNRYYFIKEELVRWIDNNGKKISKDSKKFIKKEKKLLSIIRDILLGVQT